MLRADSAHEVARLVARVLLVGHDVEHGQVRAGGQRQRLLQRRRKLRHRLREEALVVRLRIARIDVDDALDAEHVRQLSQAAAEVIGVADVASRQRATARVVDDRFDCRLILPREIAQQRVIALPCLIRRRQSIDVCIGKAELKKRRTRKQQNRQRRDQDDQRASHDPEGHRVPRPGGLGPAASEVWDAKPVHVRPEHGQHRGQKRQSVDDCYADDDRPSSPHRREERALVEQHRREADGDGDA